MKQGLRERILNSYLWIRICLLIEGVIKHLRGTRHNDSDRLEQLVKARKGDVIVGVFFDAKLKPSDVTWVKYPPNVHWHVVRTYPMFRAALMWGTVDVVSIGHEQSEGCEAGARCLEYLRKLKQVGKQDPAAVFIHQKDEHLRYVLQHSWPYSRVA